MQLMIPNKNPSRFFGVDFFASLYSGSHHSKQFFATLQEPFQTYQEGAIAPKVNLLATFEHELKSKKKGSVIGFFQNPDPYPTIEKDLRLMHEALKLIEEYEMGVFIETSSPLVERDFDLLHRIAKNQSVCLFIPVGFAENVLMERFDGKDASSLQERFKIARRAKEAQILTGMIFKPFIPFMNDSIDNLTILLNEALEAGVDFLYPQFVLSFDSAQQKAFYQLIGKEFPGLKNIYMDKYGTKRTWATPNASELKKEFVFTCKKNKILYGMKEIVHHIKPQRLEQFSLF